MNHESRRGSRSRHPAGRLTVCLAMAVATMLSAATAGDVGAPAAPAGRVGAPSILEPVPFDGGAPAAVTSPAARVMGDRRVFVIVAAFAVAAILVRTLPRRAGRELPEGVFAVLGEATLAGTHTVRVVRFGTKTILVGLNGSACTTLAEIDDAAVTAGIVDACRREVRSSMPSPPFPLRIPAAFRAAVGHRAGGVS